MAKVQLTPEEIAAKKIRRTNGWTRFWAIVVAMVLVFGASGIAANKAQTAREDAEKALAEQQEEIQQAAANNAVIGGVSGGNGTAAGGDAAAPVSDEAQQAVDAINAATAAAANATYHWTRNCVVQDIDVGDRTQDLNDIIHRIDSNADLNSVVGGFMGQGNREGDYAPGADAATVFGNDQYALKATSLQAADLQGLTVEGNTYTFTLPVAENPQKDGNTALSRLTNDFITLDEVATGVADALGPLSFLLSVDAADVAFQDIKVTVELNDAGQLVSLSYAYYMDVKSLELSIATGTGNGTVEATYSNFVY